MSKQNEMPVAMNNVSQISVGTEIKGDILCGGDLRIDGKVEGKVHVKGKMVIGASGRVDGEVTCRNGDQELLALKSTSTFEGDVSTKRLSIEPSSVFSGTCKMGESRSGALAEG